MGDQTVPMMPTVVLEQFLKEHKYTEYPREAHPIDQDVLHKVCDTKMGPMMMNYDLAVLQAVAVREVLPYDNDYEYWITASPQSEGVDAYQVERDRDTEGRLHYYQVSSRTIYEILSIVNQRYDDVVVEVENVADLAEAHTRQYLKDVHGYTGDFGGQVANDDIDKIRDPTLCNAQNDEHWLRDEEPENAYYAFTDARGFVIEEGTHREDNDNHDIDTLVAALQRTSIRDGITDDGDWNETHAVTFLTDNYCTAEDRAVEAFEQYKSVDT